MKLRILLIEDNPGDIELFRLMLENEVDPTYSIVCERNLADGMARMAEEVFDLLILDLGLPDSSGLDTLDAVIDQANDVPVVVLTGNTDEHLGLAAVKAGAEDFLTKGKISQGMLARVLRYAVERKQMHIALQDSMKQMRIILDAMDSQVLLLDKEQRIVWPNEKTCSVTGLVREELVGRKCYDIFHPDSSIPLECPYKQMIQDGKPRVVESEVVALGRDYIVSCTPVLDDEGQVDQVIHVATDITKRKQLQRELIQAHKMEAIGSLAGGIAHDFNNILSAVIGFTELARRKAQFNPDLVDDLNEIHNAGLRARDLIKQILTFARKTDEDLQPVRVDMLAKEVTRFLRSTIAASIEIETRISSGSIILANPVKIHQLFLNLCSNAAHAMEDEGLLTIRIDDVVLSPEEISSISKLVPGKYLQIQVQDTGSGISEKIIGKIFEPFFTTKGIQEGTGMGLATVHAVVEECKGDIAVVSTLGEGTTFTIRLPVLKQEKLDESVPGREVTTGGSETILLVDDEWPVCKVITRALDAAGYTVVSEIDSEKALKIFKTNPNGFDLVITDMTMPRLTGDQLAHHIVSVRSDIPVLLITGYSRQVTDDGMRKAGIVAMLEKPIETQKLLNAVREILDTSSPIQHYSPAGPRK